MGNKLIGVLNINLDGIGKLPTQQANSTLTLGGVERTPQMGTQGVDGFTEQQIPSQLDVVINIGAAVDEAAIQDYEGDITILADNGNTYVMPNAVSQGGGEISGDGGGFSITFFGDKASRA